MKKHLFEVVAGAIFLALFVFWPNLRRFSSNLYMRWLYSVSYGERSSAMALSYKMGRNNRLTSRNGYVAHNHQTVELMEGDQISFGVVTPWWSKAGSIPMQNIQLFKDGGEMICDPRGDRPNYMEAVNAGFVRQCWCIKGILGLPVAVLVVDFVISSPSRKM